MTLGSYPGFISWLFNFITLVFPICIMDIMTIIWRSLYDRLCRIHSCPLDSLMKLSNNWYEMGTSPYYWTVPRGSTLPTSPFSSRLQSSPQWVGVESRDRLVSQDTGRVCVLWGLKATAPDCLVGRHFSTGTGPSPLGQ